MQFSSIIGQKAIKDRLIQSVKDERVSHAQLFHGHPGYGGLPLALAYIQYLFCEQKSETDSCGKCNSCNKIQKLIHPDLHFVYPVAITKTVTKNPVSEDFIAEWREQILEQPYFTLDQWYRKIGIENKQGNISKNESNQIIRKLSLKTFEAEYKAMIIWMPERMNTTSANKLLKLLEEPPDKTLFILVSANTEQIIQTILSRCQMVKIPRLDEQSLAGKISGSFTLNEDKLASIVHSANGNFIEAITKIEKQDESDFNFEKFVQFMRLCYGNKVAELIGWVDEVTSVGREGQKSFLMYALKMIRENFMMNVQKPDLVYLGGQEKQFSDKFFPFVNGENILVIHEELNKAHRDIEANANNKVVFLDLSLKMVKLIKAKKKSA